jgi:hypothetical protein
MSGVRAEGRIPARRGVAAIECRGTLLDAGLIAMIGVVILSFSGRSIPSEAR